MLGAMGSIPNTSKKEQNRVEKKRKEKGVAGLVFITRHRQMYSKIYLKR
jgi:hypothetical protein